MTMRVLVLQNDGMAPAGLIEQRLVQDGVKIVTVRANEGDPIPTNVGDYDGLVVLGGTQTAVDFAGWPYLADEVALIQRFAEADRPTLGICLGSQLLALAHGAGVRPLGQLEIGFSTLRATPAANDDALFHGGEMVPQMQWHNDTFDLPAGAVLLGTGDICRNQAVRIGRCHYAVQFHFEVTKPIVDDWIAHFAIKLDQGSPGLVARLRQELADNEEGAAVYGRLLVDRWVELIRG